MKKLSDIVGLKIVTVEDGLEIGVIRGFIVEPSERKVEYFATEKGISILKSKIFKSSDIEGIGDYAVTISNNEKICDINASKDAIDLAYNGIEVLGTIVLNKKGKLIGEVINMELDDERGCVISSLEIVGSGSTDKVLVMDAKDIVTLGKDLLLVNNDSVVEADALVPDKKINSSNSTLYHQRNISKRKKQKDNRSLSDLYLIKQKQFLEGKVVLKTIIAKDGEVIVNEGQIVDDEVFEKANKKGMLLEIVKNIE